MRKRQPSSTRRGDGCFWGLFNSKSKTSSLLYISLFLVVISHPFSPFGCCLMNGIHPWELGWSCCSNKFMRLIIFIFYWKSQGAILLIIYAFGGSGNKLLWAVLVNVTVSFSLMANFYVCNGGVTNQLMGSSYVKSRRKSSLDYFLVSFWYIISFKILHSRLVRNLSSFDFSSTKVNMPICNWMIG